MGFRQQPSESLPLDLIYDVLRNQRRRLVLRYLREHETPVSLRSLAEEVASAETGVDVDEVSADDRKKAYVGLYHVHLPKMDDAGPSISIWTMAT